MNTKLASSIIGAVVALGMAPPAMSSGFVQGTVTAIQANRSPLIGNNLNTSYGKGLYNPSQGLLFTVSNDPTRWWGTGTTTSLADAALIAARVMGAPVTVIWDDDVSKTPTLITVRNGAPTNPGLVWELAFVGTRLGFYEWAGHAINYGMVFFAAGGGSGLFTSVDQVIAVANGMSANRPLNYSISRNNNYIFNQTINSMVECSSCLNWVSM